MTQPGPDPPNLGIMYRAGKAVARDDLRDRRARSCRELGGAKAHPRPIARIHTAAGTPSDWWFRSRASHPRPPARDRHQARWPSGRIVRAGAAVPRAANPRRLGRGVETWPTSMPSDLPGTPKLPSRARCRACLAAASPTARSWARRSGRSGLHTGSPSGQTPPVRFAGVVGPDRRGDAGGDRLALSARAMVTRRLAGDRDCQHVQVPDLSCR